MVYVQPRISPGEWDTQNSQVFLDTNRSPNLGQIPEQVIVHKKKKRTNRIADFVISADHMVDLKESKKNDKYLHLARKLKKKPQWNVKTTMIPIVVGVLGTVTKGLRKGVGNKRTSGGYIHCSIVEISQNTEKSPRNLRWIDLIQTPVEDHHLTLMGKTIKGIIIIVVVVVVVVKIATVIEGDPMAPFTRAAKSTSREGHYSFLWIAPPYLWYVPYNTECYGGARGVMVIVVGNGHGDTSSNSGRDWLHFT